MTEASAVMTQEEFEQHHALTQEYVARVGRVWEAIAEEQQAIIDGKGYRYLGYQSWRAYWMGQFQGKTGWSHITVAGWLKAKRIKDTTEVVRDSWAPTGPEQWKNLMALDTPEERADFLQEYPRLQAVQDSKQPFREAVKEFKAKRELGVIERMHEEDVVVPPYPSGPTPAEHAYKAASQLLSMAMDVMPETAADSISPGLAQTIARDYDVLVPWVRRFVAQLHIRASGGL